MRTVQHEAALRSYVRGAREKDRVVGFVPTMGALHDGHVSLMKRARADCDVVVVSVFVNPTQFAPGEDFERYPRDVQRDSAICQAAGVDMLFTPPVEEIYPAGSQTFVDVTDVASRWEGAVRPGHFRGVATVCTKLFQIVRANHAYFGMKDYQQLKVIERVVEDLHIPVTIVPVPTVREADGLAMSSRNAYLSEEQRAAAPVLHRALSRAEELFRSGERSGAALNAAMAETFAAEPLAAVDYAAVADADTLEPIELAGDRAVALVAARIGATRLIDNMLLLSEETRRATNNRRAR